MKIKNINTIRICSVVTGETLPEFIENMKRIQEEADLIELRVDYIPNISVNDLKIIKKYLVKKAVLTCRKKSNYGKGKFEGSFKQQNEILQYGNDIGIDYIDIEWREYEKINIVNKRAKIILSYHNWEKTSNFEELNKLVQQMRKKREDIIKIATMVHTDQDVKTLTSLLLSKKENESLIVIGMGEKAAFTRIFAPLLGSYLTFASVWKSYSAPGQLDIKTLKAIYTLLGYNI